MIIRFLLALALVSTCVARAEEAPRFVPTRYDAAAHVVRFESPVEIDWNAEARKHFTKFDFEHLTAKDIAYLRERIWEISGDAQETFSFAPSHSRRAMSYTLISARGVEALRVAAFEGTIRFDFDHSMPPVLVGTSFFGEAVSQGGVSGGGFALLSRHESLPERIVGAMVTIGRGADGVTLSYADGEGRASIKLPVKWHDKFETAFGLRVAGRRFLFVDWPPDIANYEAGCQDSFFLYEVGTTLTPVAASDYNCDV
jgi:hypothetical protein